MRLLARFLASLVVLISLAVPSLAREEIRAFASDVDLRIDGSVNVVETIDVRAEGDRIRRGIYRDIPVTMVGSAGNKICINLDVLSVLRKGKPEPYRLERMGDFLRIWIGDAEQLLQIGEHRYTITYTVARMARPTADGNGDELYWNATGNYWDFPILSSVARVRLPESAVIGDMAAYTGVAGSTERAVSVTRTADNVAVFRTQRALEAGEGMSFAVAFQKGVVSYPEGADALVQALSDLRDTILPTLGVLALLLYYVGAWLRVGRDPPRGTIIPLFHPPKGFSPALTHFVHKWGFSGSGWSAMTAAIFNLGVKGLVRIDNPGKTLTVSVTGNQPAEPLPVGERVLFTYFSQRGSVTFDKTNGPDLATKRAEFTKAIETENRTLWFNNNLGYAAGGYLIAAAVIGLMALFGVLELEWLFVAVFVGAILGIVGSAIYSTIRSGRWLPKVFMAIWGGIFAFNFGGTLIDTLTGADINMAVVSAASLIMICIVFTVLMRAPTIQGRKVMDEIDGFRLYLDTAEKNRLNIQGEPPLTVERFERILPYAIALGVEKPWSEHFEAELKRNAADDGSAGYSPGFYSGGRGFSSDNFSKAIASATSGMTAAMVAAQPVEASSSGSSGGGFSGGGGGGGGGGGW